ncbi:hypothetical protein BG004_001325 [Podila humilis]|nr:hypothetical protein BG004_001325 [Podila humilis]
MKFTIIFSAITLSLIAAFTSTTIVHAAPLTPSSQWCATYHNSCKSASIEVCGSNHKYESKCLSEFSGTSCLKYNVSCVCIPSGGAMLPATTNALEKTFGSTGGVCSNLEQTNNDTVPPTTTTSTTAPGGPAPVGVATTTTTTTTTTTVAAGATATPNTGTTPGKQSNAEKTKTGAMALMAAIAAGAVMVVM